MVVPSALCALRKRPRAVKNLLACIIARAVFLFTPYVVVDDRTVNDARRDSKSLIKTFFDAGNSDECNTLCGVYFYEVPLTFFALNA